MTRTPAFRGKAAVWRTGRPGSAPTCNPEFFVFTYRRTAEANEDSNTTVIAQYGNDLDGWTDAVVGSDVVITENPDFHGPGIDQVRVELRRSALAPEGRLFVRLKVEVEEP